MFTWLKRFRRGFLRGWRGEVIMIPRSHVVIAYRHLDTCVCLGSARDAAADLEAFLND